MTMNDYTYGKVGDRVRLISCTDPHTRLKPHDQGTIMFVDSLGTRHIDWDNGSTLGLCHGEDKWQVLPIADLIERES